MDLKPILMGAMAGAAVALFNFWKNVRPGGGLEPFDLKLAWPAIATGAGLGATLSAQGLSLDALPGMLAVAGGAGLAQAGLKAGTRHVGGPFALLAGLLGMKADFQDPDAPAHPGGEKPGA